MTSQASPRGPRAAREPVVLELRHSSRVYAQRFVGLGRGRWRYPSEAWAALREVIPWEALGLSVAGAVLLSGALRQPSEIAGLGYCLALACVTVQMFRTRTFVTPTRIVQQRGLFFLTRRETPLAAVKNGRIVRPDDRSRDFGDIVLATEIGERVLRAVPEPDRVLATLLALRDEARVVAHGA